MRKKWLAIPLAVICTLLCGIMSGCDSSKTSGDFVYTIMGNKGNEWLRLEGLSEQGKEKETIVVPKEIEGYEVWNYTYHYGLGDRGNFESNHLRQLYIIPSVNVHGKLYFERAPLLEKIIFIGELANYHFRGYIDNDVGVNLYVTVKPEPNDSDIREIEYEIGRISVVYDLDGKDLYFTNVNFLWNYEGADNEGYYWGDYFDYGTKVTYLPENPEREGYIFGGWYREAEGTNIWNFDTDTLPEAKYSADGEALYQETRLYAKWYQK